MTHSEVDYDVADPTMTERLNKMKPVGVIIGYGIVALMVLPFVAFKEMPIGIFCISLATLMAIGLAGAGLWGAGSYYMRDPLTDAPVEDRKRRASGYLLVSFGLAVITFLFTWFVTSAFSDTWVSYTVLKSGGLITYLLFGLIPVVAYIMSVYAVASRKINASPNWRLGVLLFLLPLSIWAPVVWVGFKVFSDYHVI